MKVIILTGDVIRTQLLVVCADNTTAVDFWKWLKRNNKIRNLKVKILGHDTEFTRLEELSANDLKNILKLYYDFFIPNARLLSKYKNYENN